MVAERTRAEKQAIDHNPANKCKTGCGNTARLGEDYCGLHMPVDDDTQRVRADEGCKQVLLDGHHLADAVSPEAAAVIAICCNRAGLHPDHWPRDERVRVADFFA